MQFEFDFQSKGKNAKDSDTESESIRKLINKIFGWKERCVPHVSRVHSIAQSKYVPSQNEN